MCVDSVPVHFASGNYPSSLFPSDFPKKRNRIKLVKKFRRQNGFSRNECIYFRFFRTDEPPGIPTASHTSTAPFGKGLAIRCPNGCLACSLFRGKRGKRIPNENIPQKTGMFRKTSPFPPLRSWINADSSAEVWRSVPTEHVRNRTMQKHRRNPLCSIPHPHNT